MNRHIIGVLALTVFVAAGCTSRPAETPAAAPAVTAPAPVDTTYTPVVSLNEIMVYTVDPHANELWDAAVKPPTTDEGWRQLNRAAVTIAASGNLTKLSGNGAKDAQWTQQEHWVQHSQSVADAGIAAMKAVRDKDQQQLSRAGDQLVLTCINCHREYKLEVPKIWTERQLPPEEQR
jgi:hypothetical protein